MAEGRLRNGVESPETRRLPRSGVPGVRDGSRRQHTQVGPRSGGFEGPGQLEVLLPQRVDALDGDDDPHALVRLPG